MTYKRRKYHKGDTHLRRRWRTKCRTKDLDEVLYNKICFTGFLITRTWILYRSVQKPITWSITTRHYYIFRPRLHTFPLFFIRLQINEDIQEDNAKALINQEVDLDKPGAAQHYCIHCA